MQARQFERFIKVMRLTTSPVEGESLAAIRMANSLLAEANLDWEDFLRRKARIVRGPAQKIYNGRKYTNATEIKMMFFKVLANTSPDTSFYNFVASLSDWWFDNDYLTEKQYKALKDAYLRIR